MVKVKVKTSVKISTTRLGPGAADEMDVVTSANVGSKLDSVAASAAAISKLAAHISTHELPFSPDIHLANNELRLHWNALTTGASVIGTLGLVY
jgi:hypothetical protein